MSDSIVPDLTLKDPVVATDIIYITDAVNDFRTTLGKVLTYIQANITVGITNSAGNNVIPKSNGTNLVTSRIQDSGTAININYLTGTCTLKGTGLFKIGDTAADNNSSVFIFDDNNQLASLNVPIRVNNTTVIKDQTGNQLLTDQQSSIGDVSGGAIQDTESRTAIQGILGTLRAHGLIAI